MTRRPLELVCPAGTLAALRVAVDSGADTVYVGFRDETNARNFPGLNFSRTELESGITYAHDRGVRVFVAVNTLPRAGDSGPWRQAVDDAVALGADALILADIGLLAYACEAYPGTRRHLSVQASASNAEAIRFYRDAFGIARVVLPRVLTVEDIARLIAETDVETEVFAFGGMCVMAEGRCTLSSYATGLSPNNCGVCSPASHVRFERVDDGLAVRLGAFTLDVVADGSPAGYPTLCKGRFVAQGAASYLFEEPTSLNALAILPRLAVAGVTALKIEGRQRGRAYVAEVVAVFREAVDALARGEGLPPRTLEKIAEGRRGTAGAYEKGWR